MKQTIRYLGFHTTSEGGRLFNFTVGTSVQEESVSVEVGAPHFLGTTRILVQECADICYAKVKKAFENGGALAAPVELTLTSTDITHYREVHPGPEARKARAHRVSSY